MRLSMWILADWLEEYRPSLRIAAGARSLRNARLYSDGLRMERSTVYVGNAEDFISGAAGQVICANGHDMMLLRRGSVNEVLNRILDAFDFYNGWSDRISERMRDSYSLGDMLGDSEGVLKRAVCVADASFYVLAQSGFEDKAVDSPDTAAVLNEHIITLDSILAINKDERIRVNSPRTYTLEVAGAGIRCAVRNLHFRGQHRGWLITDKRDGSFSRGETDVQDELGDLVERWLEYHQSQRELTERAGVLLQILDGSCPRGEEGYRRVESLGWHRDDELCVCAVRPGANGPPLSFSLDRRLELLGSAYSVHFGNELALVVNMSLSPAFLPQLRQLLESADCVCGRSPTFSDIFELKSNYELALIAADFGSGCRDRIRELESAALPYYFSLIAKNDRAGVSHPALRLLREYDKRHKTQLYLTLEVYLRCERNYIMAAGELNLHRNSLIYRIGRISDLTGVELDSCAARLHLMMAYELERRRSVPPS